MIRSVHLVIFFVLGAYGDRTNKPFAIPVHEREGHAYRIPTDNLREHLNFTSIALYATQNSGLFAEYNEKTHCAEFYTPRTYEKKCDGIFFLLHSDHYKYTRYPFKQYLVNRPRGCADPLQYRGTLLILDKPDRIVTGFPKPKYIGNFIERDNTISYYLNGKPVVIELVTKKMAEELLPGDRFEILCKVPRN
ncbi:unnamed protein product [Auanema sp. JU1783]|nr:unnamed protein product [Auanema sp. JU1783]